MSDPICQSCGASVGHAFDCPDIPLEEARLQLRRYHAAWREAIQPREDFRKTSHDRFVAAQRAWHEKVAFWAGKYAIVKQENNALRKRLRKQPPAAPPERADFLAACGRVGDRMRAKI